MPPSAERGAEVVEAILALERSCLAADAAIVERRWGDIKAAVDEQSRLTQRLAELFAQAPEYGPQDPRVQKRLTGVLAYREDQLRRLRAYRDEVGERLRTLAKLRAFRRGVGTAPIPSRVLNTKI
jgi:hypothetical protein